MKIYRSAPNTRSGKGWKFLVTESIRYGLSLPGPLEDLNVIIGHRLGSRPAGKDEGRFEVTAEGAITAARWEKSSTNPQLSGRKVIICWNLRRVASEQAGSKVTLLNFASAKNPCGGMARGALAQVVLILVMIRWWSDHDYMIIWWSDMYSSCLHVRFFHFRRKALVSVQACMDLSNSSWTPSIWGTGRSPGDNDLTLWCML